MTTMVISRFSASSCRFADLSEGAVANVLDETYSSWTLDIRKLASSRIACRAHYIFTCNPPSCSLQPTSIPIPIHPHPTYLPHMHIEIRLGRCILNASPPPSTTITPAVQTLMQAKKGGLSRKFKEHNHIHNHHYHKYTLEVTSIYLQPTLIHQLSNAMLS